MLKLEDREWKEFDLCGINGIFTITTTSSGIDKNKLKKVEGTNPYITRTDSNNGITGFYQEQNNYKKDIGNCITIGLDTQTVFYQSKDFYTGQNIQILRNSHMNKYIAKFLIAPLKNTVSIFNWGSNGATLKRLKRSKILLPINVKGEPDYEFMEQYIREREEEKIQEYISFARKEIEKIEKEMVETKTGHTWKEFYLKDLFEIHHGKRLVKNERKNGDTPLLTATSMNEGVSDFIKEENMETYKNVITIDMFGHSFYHKYTCCGDDNIYFLVNDALDDEVKQFISVCINRNSEKYSYGKQFREKNALNERVLLPVDENGTLDAVYMKQYIYIYTRC